VDKKSNIIWDMRPTCLKSKRKPKSLETSTRIHDVTSHYIIFSIYIYIYMQITSSFSI
jgi:hypothetical protein